MGRIVRCSSCGADARDGADVRRCDECTFGYCAECVPSKVGGAVVCDECRREAEREGAMGTGRNCLSCVHCYLSRGTPGYSEYTPSTPMAFQCDRSHWDFSQYDGMRVKGDVELPTDPKREVLCVLDFAKTCSDYSPESWAEGGAS